MTLICGIVGRLHPEKFPHDDKEFATSFTRALRAWDHGEWEIEIIGQGYALEWQERFKAEVSGLKWIRFKPDVVPSEIVATYKRLDALLVPTPPATGETACYSAVEAMACGVPVVARELHGLRQSCHDGALYGTTDYQLLAQLRRLDSLTLRQAVSVAGVEVARKFHDVIAHVDVHNRAFTNALPVDVSVNTCVYNTNPRHIREYWASLQQQTFRRWEAVIVDDASTRGETCEELDKLADDPRVRLIRLKKNVGGGVAKNMTLHECRAELIAVLDSDDIAYPERLERQYNWMRTRPNVDVLGAQIDAFDDLTEKALFTTRHPQVITREVIEEQKNAKNLWFLNHPTVMHRKSCVLKAGGYSNHTVCHDLALWLKLFKQGACMRNLPESLVRYRIHQASLTAATARRTAQYNDVVKTFWGE